MLSDVQLRLMAETLSNIGVVFFGSLVVPLLAGSEIAVGIIIAGFALSTTAWITSIAIIKYVNI